MQISEAVKKISIVCIGHPSCGIYFTIMPREGFLMSKKLRRWELASFLFAAIAGPLLHFTYQWGA